MNIETTKYYDEFLRYYEMAKTQQIECNLGTINYKDSSVDDDLMKNVHLYDVVNRKYAGFTQILQDLWHNTQDTHPYKHKFHEIRKPIVGNFDGVHNSWSMREWLYVFLIHRLTGSGINYAKNPSGYYNTILPDFHSCDNIELMKTNILNRSKTGPSFYTSVGYQFPAFPKPIGEYKTGGNMFLIEHLPELVDKLVDFITSGNKKDLRQIGDFMFNWNRANGFRAYKFQYAAFIADIADFYPEYVNIGSLFYYGTNARECIKYFAYPIKGIKEQEFLDLITLKACNDTGGNPYDIEDVMCDTIRWIENYARPGGDYDHLDLDKVFSSCKITNHPFGRQKRMLELGLIDSFNNLNVHPSDDYIISRNNITAKQYMEL